MDFSFCRLVSRHLSPKAMGTALRLFRLCRVEDRSELRRLVSHRLNSDACIADPAVMDFLSNLSLGAGYIFRGVAQDVKSASSSGRSEVGKNSSTVTSEMKMTAEKGADVDAYALHKVMLDRQREELENKKKALAAMRQDFLRDLAMEDQFRVRQDDELCTMEDVIHERQQLERQNEELAALREKLLREEVQKEHLPTTSMQQRENQAFRDESTYFGHAAREVDTFQSPSYHSTNDGLSSTGVFSHLRRFVGGSLGQDMVSAWNAAGHSEQSLAEMVRVGPSSVNETKLLLMNELLNLPHERIPASVRIGELVQITADFFYSTSSPRIGRPSFTATESPRHPESSSYRDRSPPPRSRRRRSRSRSRSPLRRMRGEIPSGRQSGGSTRFERKERGRSSPSPRDASSAWESNESLPKVTVPAARPATGGFSLQVPTTLETLSPNVANIAKHGISFPPPTIPPPIVPPTTIPPLMSQKVNPAPIPPLMSKNVAPVPPPSSGHPTLLPYPPPALALPDPQPGRSGKTLVQISLDDRKVVAGSGYDRIRNEPTPPPPGELERNEDPQTMHDDHAMPLENPISATTPPPGEPEFVSATKPTEGKVVPLELEEINSPVHESDRRGPERDISDSEYHRRSIASRHRHRSPSPGPYMSSGRHRSRSPVRQRHRSRTPPPRRGQIPIHDLDPSVPPPPRRQEKHPLSRYLNQSRIDNAQALYDDVATFFARREVLDRVGNIEKSVTDCVREAAPDELVVVLKGEGEQLGVKQPEVNKVIRAAGGERYSME